MLLLRSLFTAVWVVLTCFILPVWAQDTGTNAAHLKINLIESVWRVNADATSVLELYAEREALSDMGATMIGKFATQINKTLQRYEIIEAYTLKADGQKVMVGKDGIQIQEGVATGGTGISWPDAQIYQITFPNLQKGDRSVWRSRMTTFTPMLPHWATYADFGIPTVAYDKILSRVEAPQSLGLNVFSQGWATSKTQSDGLDRWQFEFSQTKAKVVDANPTNTIVTYPRIFASTFKDQTQLAAAYAAQANAKAIVTNEVKTLVANLTEGKNTPLEKTTVIHDWVRKNIRYVAVFLGTGGWVPHDVDWILKNRYGDCKDHVLLMQTMLKAANIEAAPALINTTNEYELAELPIGFNHVIVYMPSLNLFADPTDSRIPLGSLPFADADKPVVVALNGGAKVMRTPVFTSATNRITVKSKWDIAKSGKAVGWVDIEGAGFAGTVLQDRVSQIPSGLGGTAVNRILASNNLRGRGFTQFPAVQRDTQTQTFKLVDLEVENFINDPQAGSINPQPRLNLPVYVINQITTHSPEKREYAMICTPLFAREEFDVTFDPVFKLFNLPANFKESHPDGMRFEAQYSVEGNTIKGWREYELTHSRHSCSKEDYAVRREIMNKITLHLNRPVLFQQP